MGGSGSWLSADGSARQPSPRSPRPRAARTRAGRRPRLGEPALGRLPPTRFALLWTNQTGRIHAGGRGASAWLSTGRRAAPLIGATIAFGAGRLKSRLRSHEVDLRRLIRSESAGYPRSGWTDFV